MSEQKINVLILVDKFDYHGSYINGPTRYYSWLVEGLDRERFGVYLCALRGKGKSDAIFRRENIEVSYLNVGKYDPFTAVKIIQFIRRNKITLLHLTGYGATTFGRLAGIFCGIPAIVHEHWVDPNLGRMQTILERSLNFSTAKAIAISDYAQKFLIEKKGLRSDQIAVIPNGIPLDKFRNITEEAGLLKRQELGLAHDSPLIGMIGMLHENKGHQYFIEAAALISAKQPQTRFLIIGDGGTRQQLEQQAAQLGLKDQVMFLGHRDDISTILKALDIFVIASISESFSLSLLEAMAAKKAIVTTDCGGPSEMIRDGVTGYIIPSRDALAMAEKINYLIDNPSVSELLSGNAQADSEKYDIRLTIQKIQAVYEETVSYWRQGR